MKKLFTALLLCVTATGLFAAVAPKADDLGKALEQAQAQAAAKQSEKVTQLQKQLEDSLAYFKKFAADLPYSNYSFMFQGMDSVRESYLNLRKADRAAAQAMVLKVNEPISIDNGSYQIRIADYVRMESVVLGSVSAREEATWREFSNALEADLSVAKAAQKATAKKTAKEQSVKDLAKVSSVPAMQEELKKVEPQVKQLKNSLTYFRKFAADLPYSNYSFMFQGMDSVRESFMGLYKASKPAAKALAKEVNEPISIDNGSRQIRIADYVRMESVVLGSVSSREEALWIEFSQALEKSLK